MLGLGCLRRQCQGSAGVFAARAPIFAHLMMEAHFSSDDDVPGRSLRSICRKRKRENGERDSDVLSVSPARSTDDDVALDMDDGCESSASSYASLSDPGAVSVDMELEYAGSEDPRAQTRERWSPGVNCGPFFVRREAPLLEQAMVLVVNVCMTVRRLPLAILRRALQHLGVSVRCNYADHLAARLLCISRSTGTRTVAACEANRWVPPAPMGASTGGQSSSLRQASAEEGQLQLDRMNDDALVVRSREALSVAHDGSADESYIRAMTRMRASHVLVGTQYDHHSFVERVELKGMVAAQSLLAEDMRSVLPGTGLPSDFRGCSGVVRGVVWGLLGYCFGVSLGASVRNTERNNGSDHIRR